MLPALSHLCLSGDRERQIHAVAAMANIAEMVEGRTQKRMIEEGCIKPLLGLVDSPDVSWMRYTIQPWEGMQEMSANLFVTTFRFKPLWIHSGCVSSPLDEPLSSSGSSVGLVKGHRVLIPCFRIPCFRLCRKRDQSTVNLLSLLSLCPRPAAARLCKGDKRCADTG